MARTERRRRGFTLIEILTVVLIVGLLAVVAVMRYAESKERAFLATLKSDLRTVAGQAESYYAMHDSYDGFSPPSLSAGVTLQFASTGTGWHATVEHQAMPGRRCLMSAGAAADSAGGRIPTCQ